MVELLLFRERMRKLYSKYDFYIIALAKFFLALIALLLVNGKTGYSTKLNNPFLSVAIALLCSFLPPGAISFFLCVLVVLHFTAVSGEIAVLAAILFLMMFLFYFILKPGNSYLMAVAIVCCFLDISGSIGILVGLSIGPLAALPIGFAILFYTLIEGVNINFSSLANQTGSMGGIQKFIYGIDVLIKNEGMWVMIFSLVATICFVYWIHRLSVRHSWSIAIVAGAVVYPLTMFVSALMLDIKMNLFSILINVILSILISVIYYFFVFAVDYSRTEYVQFEDDDYYYYVKAVPKIKVANPQVEVKNITAKAEEDAGEESASVSD